VRNSLSSFSHKENKAVEERIWKEYTDSESGKKYYSDGYFSGFVPSTWDKPKEVIINEEEEESAVTAAVAAADGTKNIEIERLESAKSNEPKFVKRVRNSLSSFSHKENKAVEERIWKEYTDSESGKKYYSDGYFSGFVPPTWDKPKEVIINKD